MLSPQSHIIDQIWYQTRCEGRGIYQCQWILHLSITSLSLTILIEEETCYSLFDVNNLDADAIIVHSCPSRIPSPETFSHSSISSAWKSRCHPIGSPCLFKLDRSYWEGIPWWSRLHDADQWGEMIEEAEIGANVSLKVSKQKQNTTCLDLDSPWSHPCNSRHDNAWPRPGKCDSSEEGDTFRKFVSVLWSECDVRRKYWWNWTGNLD
jgi:hypothetical protein